MLDGSRMAANITGGIASVGKPVLSGGGDHSSHIS
jgi:hypothetical protein